MGEHAEGDCYTRDCVLQQGIACCGACEQFPCDTIMTQPHTTVLDREWLRWKRESKAAIWQTHPFRGGNIRSIVAFSVLLAAKLGVELDYEVFAKHAAYVRKALVWCTQGMYSIYDYLERIYFDAADLLDNQPERKDSVQKDYSMIEGYHVADYQEQPHTYAEEYQ